MKKVTIPSSVTTIGSEAFLDCSISSLTISEGVVSLRDFAFWASFRGLKTLRIPDSITMFGHNVFWNCEGIENLYAGKNTVSTLGFCDEVGHLPIPIKNVYLTNLELWIKTIPFEEYNYKGVCNIENLYVNGQLVTHLVIPEGIEYIGEGAFYTCTAITTVTVPRSTTIHPNAFNSSVTIIRI